MTTTQPAKVLSAVKNFIKMVKSHTRCSSMKAHTVWMPASLNPNGKGGYAVLNINGFLIGETQQMKIPKDWVISRDAISLNGYTLDTDGVINLFGTGYPWETESNKSEYLGRLTDLFRVPDNLARRPAPIHRVFVGG